MTRLPIDKPALVFRLGNSACGHTFFSDKQRVLVEEFSNALQSAGVGENQIVAVALQTAEAMLAAIIAVWNCNAVPFPFGSSNLDPSTYDHLVLSHDHIMQGKYEGNRAGLDETVVLHATSGSTGHPKVSRKSIDSFLDEIDGYRKGLDLSAKDLVRVPLPLDHSFGFGVAMSAAFSGCSLVVSPVLLPKRLAHEIDTDPITKIALTPALARLIVEVAPVGSPSLEAAVIGAGVTSGSLRSDFNRRFGVMPLVGYGSTETGGTFLGEQGLGMPIDSVSIVEPEAGARGELVIETRSPVSGYLSEPVRTERRWKTGDLVVRDASGQVHFERRLGKSIRANARFWDFEPLCDALSSWDKVKDFAILSLPKREQPDLERVWIALECKQLSRTAAIEALAGLLPRGIESQFFVADQLPRNSLGKLDRHELEVTLGNAGVI